MTAPTRAELHELVDQLADDEVGAAARYLRKLRTGHNQPDAPIVLRYLRPEQLIAITGLVSWGGDAVAGSEAIYDE